MQEIETSCQELKINQGVAYIYLDIDCPSISDGCHVMLGNALAKWIACCPVPEDISRATRALSDVTLLCNTARIGSLFLSAAAAFSILHIRRHVPGNKSNTWRARTATGRTNQNPTRPLKAAKYGDPRHFRNCANAQNKCMHFDDGRRLTPGHMTCRCWRRISRLQKYVFSQ